MREIEQAFGQLVEVRVTRIACAADRDDVGSYSCAKMVCASLKHREHAPMDKPKGRTGPREAGLA